MKIPFDVKYRPQIESGEYQVTNSICEAVRVICWDADIISTPSCGKKPIISLQHGMDNHEVVVHHLDNGKVFKSEDTLADLFILTPEPELTEFERGIKRGFLCAGLEDVPTGIIKDTAQDLLTIAKKELCNDCVLKAMEEIRVYKYEGPVIPAFWSSCYYGGPCTNPHFDCINCPRRSIQVSFNTSTGTSAAKEENEK